MIEQPCFFPQNARRQDLQDILDQREPLLEPARFLKDVAQFQQIAPVDPVHSVNPVSQNVNQIIGIAARSIRRARASSISCFFTKHSVVLRAKNQGNEWIVERF